MSFHNFHLACLLSLICFFTANGYGQSTIISGVITDGETGEPLPTVSILFPGTSIGTITDFDGRYRLETKKPGDSLEVSFLGYEKQRIQVKPNVEQEINVALNSSAITLQSFEIKADRKDKNPALIFMKKAIANKDANNPYKQDFLEYEVYSKIELDLNNIEEELEERKVMKRFGFMLDQKVEGDSTTKAYIPIILAENISQYYYRRTPKAEHEILLAAQVSGVKNESVKEQLANTELKINIYEDYINIFNRGFISPVAETGPLFYRYYFLDSAMVRGEDAYLMKIVPRRSEDLVFRGEMWISKSSYAILELELSMTKNANLNWVNGIDMEQKFEKIDDTYVIKDEFMLIDFNLNDRNTMTGLYARRNSSYDKIQVNQPRKDSVYDGTLTVTDSAYMRADDFWVEGRHDTLSNQEQTIYTNVQRIQKIPFFMSLKELTTTVLTGYKTLGIIDVGPYLNLVTQNPIEGLRIHVGAKTNASFSKQVQASGHVAYGFLDQRVKYGAGLLYQPKKDPRLEFGVNYKYDIEQIGQSESAYPVNHLLGSVLRRKPLDKLSMARELEVYADKEWVRSLSNRISLTTRDVFPNQYDSFSDFGGFIRTTEIGVSGRIALGEKVLIGDFNRINLGNKKPTIRYYYGYGIPHPVFGEFEYHKVTLDLKHQLNMGALGYAKYYVSAGKVWGNLPYVLLNVLPGNENYTYDHLSYNLMNYYEFVVDEYASLYYTHYFNGLFLNKIPLVKKLQFRELVWGKGIVGGLSKSHQQVHPFPSFLNDLNVPYYEAGFGIENILKVLRFDCFWRLSHLDNADVSRIALRGSLQLKF